jgi:ribosomal protein S6--L-glutamate ligase
MLPGDRCTVVAQAPLRAAELLDRAQEHHPRRGQYFTMDYSHDEPCPPHVQQEVIDYDAVLPASARRSPTSAPPSCASSSRWTCTRPTRRRASTTRRDKLRSLQILSRHDIGIPRRRSCATARTCCPAIERVGGAPVIIKILEGTQGVGVILADNEQGRRGDHRDAADCEAERADPAVREREQGPGHPRVRRRRPGRRGDAPRGPGRRVPQQRAPGRARPRRSSSTTLQETAVRARRSWAARRGRGHARGPQRRAAGHGGQLVARARGHRGRTGLDIAGAIVDYIAGPGPTSRRSTSASGSRSARGTAWPSCRRGDRVIESGDRLLCFGKRDALSELVPERRRRRRRPKVRRMPVDRDREAPADAEGA